MCHAWTVYNNRSDAYVQWGVYMYDVQCKQVTQFATIIKVHYVYVAFTTDVQDQGSHS